MTYNPVYTSEPFTHFESITTATALAELNFNWREVDLPERIRTKHVHRLHPYLGKYIPQLVEIFLRKYQPKVVCDPFAGSGTTLVEANVLGMKAIGCDISAFNCLLASVKTANYDLKKLEAEVRDILARTEMLTGPGMFKKKDLEKTDNLYLNTWFAPKALHELLSFRSLIPDYEYQDVLKVVLSRSARSARLTTHYDLDFPKKAQTEPYECYKHRRVCKPTDDAWQFLVRYGLDTVKRLKEFSEIKTKSRVSIINGDAREVHFPKFDAVITSPPYVGLIDYHEQHRYAYELLGLPMKESLEIGAASEGKSKRAADAYIEGIGQVFSNMRRSLSNDGVVVIVVNDKNQLYKDLAPRIGFKQVDTITRHVNRRTGRRSGDFYEEILIWKKNG